MTGDKMRKRVLLAEQSDTIRGMAESVLRQAGLEVISVSGSEKAKEVLGFSRPDLIIVGADLKTADDHALYEHVQQDAKSASIPMLILRSPSDPELPYPEEVIVNKPFDPKELLDKVNVFAGATAQSPASVSAPSGGLAGADLEDDFLDAALGIDQLEVTASEDMDKTKLTTKKRRKKAADKMIGLDHEVSGHDRSSDSSRVEALHIRDAEAEISVDGNGDVNKPQSPPLSETGGIEILNDQYGMVDSGQLKADTDDGEAHDYDWFVDSMRDEIQSVESEKVPMSKRGSPGTNLNISEPSAAVSPSAPGPPGVDKFIEEFKKEIENIRADEPQSITIDDVKSEAAHAAGEIVWEESMEKVTSDQVNMFTRELVSELAEKLAQKIADKIDGDKLLSLIKDEILARGQASRKK